MTDQTGKPATETDPSEAPPEKFGRRSMPTMSMDVAKVRKVLAQVLWGVCVLFAAVLAAAVLLISIDANTQNDLVRFIGHFADHVDLGFFDLTSPIKDFDTKTTNPAEDVKTALFNYGLCAIVWLVLGRVLDRIVRP